MKFNIKEWTFIRHCIECAEREFKKQSADCRHSDDPNSMYQIFARQISECSALIEKINNTEI